MKFEKNDNDKIVILYEGVPYIEQKRAMSCWYASAKMVLAFSRPNNLKIKDHMVVENAEKREAIDALLIKSHTLKGGPTADKVGATEKDWPVIAEAFGFGALTEDEVKAAGSKFDELVKLLEKYGPLWCAGRFFQGGDKDGGHVIVVIGAVVRKTGNNILFHDPAPEKVQGGPTSYKLYDAYFKAKGAGKNGLFGLDETEGVSPIMYKKPKK